jgi:hypothetical protein
MWLGRYNLCADGSALAPLNFSRAGLGLSPTQISTYRVWFLGLVSVSVELSIPELLSMVSKVPRRCFDNSSLSLGWSCPLDTVTPSKNPNSEGIASVSCNDAGSGMTLHLARCSTRLICSAVRFDSGSRRYLSSTVVPWNSLRDSIAWDWFLNKRGERSLSSSSFALRSSSALSSNPAAFIFAAPASCSAFFTPSFAFAKSEVAVCKSTAICVASPTAASADVFASPAFFWVSARIWSSWERRAVSAFERSPSKTPSPTTPAITRISPRYEAGIAPTRFVVRRDISPTLKPIPPLQGYRAFRGFKRHA